MRIKSLMLAIAAVAVIIALEANLVPISIRLVGETEGGRWTYNANEAVEVCVLLHVPFLTIFAAIVVLVRTRFSRSVARQAEPNNAHAVSTLPHRNSPKLATSRKITLGRRRGRPLGRRFLR
jgi:hypothetical protein